MMRSRKNRTFILFSAFICLLSTRVPVCVAEELVGTVVSVDEVSHQLTVDVKKENAEDAADRRVTVRLPKHMIFKRPTGHMIPHWAGVGNTVRFRGDYLGDHRQVFVVRMVHHHFRGPGFDPTGVRNRIGKGCRPGFGMRNGSMFDRNKRDSQEKNVAPEEERRETDDRKLEKGKETGEAVK